MNASPTPQRPGQGERCPHCGAKAGVSLDDEGFGICLVCGGPRVLVDAALERPQKETPFLARAKALRFARAAWFASAVVAGGFTLFGAAVALGAVALFDLGVLGTLGSAAIVLLPALFLLYGFNKAKSISRERTATLEEARRVVAGELLQARPELSPGELARLLHTSEDAALELIAHAQVGGLLADAPGPAVRFRLAETDDDAPPEPQAEAAKMQRRE